MEQAKNTQEILAGQTATEQRDNSLKDQIADSSLSSIVDSEDQNEEGSFWFSWYNAIMLLSLGFFLYYFPRLIGYPIDTYQVTDFIATMIDCIGFLLAFVLLLMTFSEIMGGIITLSILCFLCSIPIIIVMELVIKHGTYPRIVAVFLLFFQILALFNGALLIYLVFFILYQAKHTKESIRAFLQMVTVKSVFTFLLAVLGAITAIVPFIQLVLSLITGKR